MKNKIIYFVVLLLVATLCSSAVTPGKRRAVYNSLDPLSISQHLAFYELYPHTQEGKQSLSQAWNLLNKKNHIQSEFPQALPFQNTLIEGIVGLVNKQANIDAPELNEHQLAAIENLASHLPNRLLKGYFAETEMEVLSLPTEEVDLARGLFLSEIDESRKKLNQIRSYEAMIDLMALQILSRVDILDSPEKKIRVINDFIFHEMGFRFPPHSLYAKDIDVYTFLPSVLDTRKGVCLGVSILYLCLAQRLDLSLEMITPPGHIYVRFNDGKKVINIETTARGIHVDSKEYLGIATRSLQQRTIKDVIGLAHYNQASVFWQKEKHEKAVRSYRIAQKYLPNDKQLQELLAYNLIFTGDEVEGRKLLKEVKDHLPEHAVSKEQIANDFLDGKVDAEGIKAIFSHVDETRNSILEKKERLRKTLEKYPEFRAGLTAMAVTWLQLHRSREALEWLKKYHRLDSSDPTTEYYLAAIFSERQDFQSAWKHLLSSEKIVAKRDHYPRALKQMRRQLIRCCPE